MVQAFTTYNAKSTYSISRTAQDALQAKSSALVAGYSLAPSRRDPRIYADLLKNMQQATNNQVRQQTPLVNAGYAIRAACILHTVSEFILFHQSVEAKSVQIVFLGAGLDVSGLWSLLAFPDVCVHVVELDVLEVSATKTKALQQLEELISFVVELQEKDNSTCFQGYCRNQNLSTYRLVHADLQDMESVTCALGSCSLKARDTPTLVVTELVLAYLEESSCDRLIRWCSLNLCQCPTSCFLAWEPLGPDFFDKGATLQKEYKQTYNESFANKLRKGDAVHSGARMHRFQCVGCSAEKAARRFQMLGFKQACAASAGKAAWIMREYGTFDFTALELFDEHAALTLHLQTYCMALAFANPTAPPILMALLCPWSKQIRPRVTLLPNHLTGKFLGFYTGAIARNDESAIRGMFVRAYHDLGKQYSAVRKMVKTALKKDLASSDLDGQESRVCKCFAETGGVFLVATFLNVLENGVLEQIVIGGLGIRKWTGAEYKARQEDRETYEVARLVVSPEFRRSGVGGVLLDHAIDFARRQCQSRPFQFIATTPVVLDAANSFYLSKGFEVMKNQEIGELLMMTYRKRF